MALALDIPAYGVCTLDVIAAEVVAGGVTGEFLVATDARRKEVYLAAYDDAGRVTGPEVLRPADAASELPVAGQGALLYPDAFPDAVEPVFPSAAALCDVVVGERVQLLDLEPLYLRRPDAVEPGKPKRVS